MPVDQSVALGVKPPNPTEALDNVSKSMKAIRDAASIMGKGMGTAQGMADAAGNSFAFNPNTDNK